MRRRSTVGADSSSEVAPTRSLLQNVRDGIRRGVTIAAGFSGFLLIMALLRGSVVYDRYGGITTWQAIAFYFGAGIAGGALFGLLRPIQHRYAGKLVTAYLLLFLVYGGGSVAMLPILTRDDPDPVPPKILLTMWAVICLLLAPLYVRVTRSWGE